MCRVFTLFCRVAAAGSLPTRRSLPPSQIVLSSPFAMWCKCLWQNWINSHPRQSNLFSHRSCCQAALSTRNNLNTKPKMVMWSKERWWGKCVYTMGWHGDLAGNRQFFDTEIQQWKEWYEHIVSFRLWQRNVSVTSVYTTLICFSICAKFMTLCGFI